MSSLPPSLSFLLLLSFLSSHILFVSSSACTVTCPNHQLCPAGCTNCTEISQIKQCTGTCGSGDCDLVAGYSQIDECRWSCCMGGFTVRKSCQYTCKYKTSNCVACKPNFFGILCQACPNCNSGTCRSGMSGDGSCICPQGATGPYCQYTNAGTCSGHGIARWDGTCQCSEGYVGFNCGTCATDWYPVQGTGILTCQRCTAANTCNGAGTCAMNPTPVHTCDCNENYTGSTCDTCATNAFRVNGQCIFCSRTATCNNHGSCTNSATCQCDPIYTGASCDTCSTGRVKYPACSVPSIVFSSPNATSWSQPISTTILFEYHNPPHATPLYYQVDDGPMLILTSGTNASSIETSVSINLTSINTNLPNSIFIHIYDQYEQHLNTAQMDIILNAAVTIHGQNNGGMINSINGANADVAVPSSSSKCSSSSPSAATIGGIAAAMTVLLLLAITATYIITVRHERATALQQQKIHTSQSVWQANPAIGVESSSTV